ncbi:MAG TPA: asparagine synthase (glutamine-hydrolyzing) [Chthoniobacterales bacterium]|nr:asparagine synthase (glutamine-hydrolyzing) [Chthoniobacterales bacterium]
MCGIAGIIESQLSRDALEARLQRLQTDLHHRGPDDAGMYVSGDARAGLVNTRLAIQDLSPAGNQPMHSADGRYHIVFNGEIYNVAELRSELQQEGVRFASECDTEVVLKLFERYGADSVRELSGMFAVAIWDDLEKALFLARGPLGIKPLYYCTRDEQLAFASEIRALLNTGLGQWRLSQEAVSEYLLFGAVQEPGTLIDGVRTLPAGHYLIARGGSVRVTKFWDVTFGNRRVTQAEAARTVREALANSVERHLVSDVPVGLFLSGGIDSTAILALASKRGITDLRTFSISFDDPRFNEGDVAARTAAHFGTRHTDWRLDSRTAKSLLEQFVLRSDQPSIDGFNTFCVSKLAHDEGLKVVLSGLGGDEVFGGYDSFRTIPKMVRASRLMTPLSPVRSGAGRLLERAKGTSQRFRRLGRFMADVPITSTAYWAMRGIFTPSEVLRLLPRYGLKGLANPAVALHVPPQPTLEDEVSYLELTRYMRNQLLRDSDVMSMAWGLELRVPFVDSRLIEAVQNIPAELRLAGKQLLLEAVPEIPEWVRNRPKQGFAFPFKEWVTGEWNDVFRQIEEETPVRLGSWYRCWCVFALDRFVERHGLAAG